LYTGNNSFAQEESVSRRVITTQTAVNGDLTPVRKVLSRSISNQKVQIFGGYKLLNLTSYVITETRNEEKDTELIDSRIYSKVNLSPGPSKL
jgi:hypothetical protein